MISVVTPSYGQLEWLRLAVASVADQENVEVEHIVQDGGTLGIEEMFRAEDSLRDAKLVVEKDAGMYDAINRGLSRARGEVCGYLNCDEQYLLGTLATVDRFFRTHPQVDVLFGDFILVDEHGKPLSYRRIILPTGRHISFAHLTTASCAMFFRRRLFERGFVFDPEWKTAGDAVWVQSLLRDRVPMQVIREPLALFTVTGGNLGASALSRAEVERLSANASLPKVQRVAAIGAHRVRKLLAGAYRSRTVDFDLYTLASPRVRERRHAHNLGFGWPTTGSRQG